MIRRLFQVVGGVVVGIGGSAEIWHSTGFTAEGAVEAGIAQRGCLGRYSGGSSRQMAW